MSLREFTGSILAALGTLLAASQVFTLRQRKEASRCLAMSRHKGSIYATVANAAARR